MKAKSECRPVFVDFYFSSKREEKAGSQARESQSPRFEKARFGKCVKSFGSEEERKEPRVQFRTLGSQQVSSNSTYAADKINGVPLFKLRANFDFSFDGRVENPDSGRVARSLSSRGRQ